MFQIFQWVQESITNPFFPLKIDLTKNGIRVVHEMKWGKHLNSSYFLQQIFRNPFLCNFFAGQALNTEVFFRAYLFSPN